MSLFRKQRRRAEEDETVTVEMDLPVEEAIQLADEITEAVEDEVEGIVEDVKEAMSKNRFSRPAIATTLHRLNTAGIFINVPSSLKGSVQRLSSKEARMVNQLVKEVTAATEKVLAKAARAISREAGNRRTQKKVAARVDRKLVSAKILRSSLSQPISDKPVRKATSQPAGRRQSVSRRSTDRRRSILDI